MLRVSLILAAASLAVADWTYPGPLPRVEAKCECPSHINGTEVTEKLCHYVRKGCYFNGEMNDMGYCAVWENKQCNLPQSYAGHADWIMYDLWNGKMAIRLGEPERCSEIDPECMGVNTADMYTASDVMRIKWNREHEQGAAHGGDEHGPEWQAYWQGEDED